jgi:His/Glu/Gln/Arg/opine family amino acid ABC transporter permease subunit
LPSERIRIGIKFDQPGLGFKDGDAYSGFDVDVAKYVAKELGYSENQIEFKEAPSKNREVMLQNGDVDMIFATYTISDKRKEMVSFAGPYFVAGQDLLVRNDDARISGPEQLDGRNLCSVTGSTSAQTIKSKFSKSVNLMEQPSYAECLSALMSGTVDAITTDDIILAGLAARSGGGRIRLVANPFTVEPYGVGINKGNRDLADKINSALQHMIDSGAWESAIESNTSGTGFSYNLQTNPPQFEPLEIIDQQAAELSGANSSEMGLARISYLFEKYPIVNAFFVNIKLTLWSGLFALLLGILLVVMRISPIPSLRIFASGFVELFRNIPLTVVMVIMILGVWNSLRIEFSTDFDTNFFWLAVVGLAVYHSAFVCEALRSGINTVPIGQAESARALGFNFLQSTSLIILPQAFRGAIAPIGNTLIALLKNTTVAAAASVATETSSVMSSMIEFDPQLIFVTFTIFALGYVIIIIPIGLITTYLSEKLAVMR